MKYIGNYVTFSGPTLRYFILMHEIVPAFSAILFRTLHHTNSTHLSFLTVTTEFAQNRSVTGYVTHYNFYCGLSFTHSRLPRR